VAKLHAILQAPNSGHWLYQGNRVAALGRHENKIYRTVNCIGDSPSRRHFRPTVFDLFCPLLDHEHEVLFPRVATVTEQLHANLQHGPVLVYCLAGRHRSCAVVLYYLMTYGGMPVAERAVQWLAQCNPEADVTPAWIDQIRRAAAEFHSTVTSRK